MKKLNLWARHLPIFLLAIFGGTALIACNPGYFWDDWVWLFQDSTNSIRIGRELGVWWAGYLTNAINHLAAPSLTLRAVALISWVITGAAIAFVLRRRDYISSREAVQLFLIYCATHVVPVRFLTSVAMYNVYIAAFWIGCALLIAGPRSFKLRLASLLFLFFSFYLNSLLVLYALLIALLALDELSQNVTVYTRPTWKLAGLRPEVGAIIAKSIPPLKAFALRHISFLALPLIFLAVKKFTTIPSPLYGTYNDVDHRFIFSAITDSFTLIRPVLRDFFATAARTVAPVALVIAAVICFLLLRLLPRGATRTSMRVAIIQLVLGLLIFAAAVYPYIIVAKTPDLMSFYDARNIMPAVAGLDLILLALLNVLDRGFAYVPILRSYGRDLVLGYILGASICAGFVSGVGLWHDWIRQSAGMYYLAMHRNEVRDARTFVFNDMSTDSRYRDRTVLNYEYTGNLIAVFGERSRFGISVSEYFSLPPNVPLLTNTYVRQRFNIGDYDFRKPHVIVTIRDGVLALNTKRTLSVVWSYLQGENWQASLHNYFYVDLAREFVETDPRVDEMYQMAKALAAYRLEHGVFPTKVQVEPGQLPAQEISATGQVTPTVITGDIPGLFPAYMPRLATMQPHPVNEPNYLYISDGVDYKLVYSNARDQAYAKQSHPALFDPVHGGYGVWTSNARFW
ncbi:hypothetical protein B0G76_7896 [Paraburkholderia sp. BL23I1N1]|uniref:hypothetical protein n=1 Tax=Paraburkholderia sp. BL23I1N1 TaxID=1938802 RepID=UPI000FEF2B11|nr:hypothetical protein [Paraburkholderia sp. BL23I1N1]RKE26281.1 hypothetical protein B0G76_7896 [Paraburkholderia sp. BL23I1N1]